MGGRGPGRNSGLGLLSSMELMINGLIGLLFGIVDLSLNSDFPLDFGGG